MDEEVTLVILWQQDEELDMKEVKTISRNADKFVVRMPKGMRDRFKRLSEDRHISMNSNVVQGLESYLDGQEDLKAMLAGIRLLRDELNRQKVALEQERKDVAALNDQLTKELAIIRRGESARNNFA